MSGSNSRNQQNGRPVRLIDKAEYVEFLAGAEALPIRQDMVVLLEYIRDNKIIGTQSTGNMPLKAIREVTARFVDPPVLDHKIGDRIYRLRTEDDVWELYFLHVLAQVGGLLTSPRAKQWRLRKKGKEFLQRNSIQQVFFLLSTWWYSVNWLIAFPYEGMGDSLPPGFNITTRDLLEKTASDGQVDFAGFADELIRLSGLKWKSADESSRLHFLHGSIEKMVILTLEKFGAVECAYRDKPVGNSSIRILVGFKVTKSGLEWLHLLGNVPY